MGKRLTRISTRTGDDGTTGLADGSRLPKNAARIEALGDVDELNSTLALVLSNDIPPEARETIAAVQNDLFDIGGELAIPGHVIVNDGHLARLDQAIASMNATLPPLREFILPGGCRASAEAHLARTVCRRAERRVVALGDALGNATIVRYLNRLSDVLFILARVLNRHAGISDVYWKLGASRGGAPD